MFHASQLTHFTAIKLRRAINRFEHEYKSPSRGINLKAYFLDDNDWIALQRWGSLLRAFKLCERTEEHRAQKRNVGTIAGVIRGLTFMWERVQRARKEEQAVSDHCSQEYVEGLDAADDKLMKYFELLKSSPFYYAAVALDPSVRLHWFEDKWGGYDGNSWLRTAKKQFRALFDRYAAEQAFGAPTTCNTMANEVPESPQPAIDDDDAYIQFGGLSSAYIERKRKRANSVTRDKDEYTRYVEGQPSTEVIDDMLGWWRAHADEYPILAKMAVDVLSIPATSAEIERVFSQAGRLLSDDRNSLYEGMVEAIMVQGHGLRSGLFATPTI